MSDAPIMPDNAMPEDPFPDELFFQEPVWDLPDYDYVPEDDPFEPVAVQEIPVFDAPPSPGVGEHDPGWTWYDAALVAVERVTPDGEDMEYAVGCVDLYTNTGTGEIGGNYLEIGASNDLETAAALYHEVQGAMHAQRILPFERADFAQLWATDRAHTASQPTSVWRECTPGEIAAYEALETPDLLEPSLIAEPTVEPESPAFKALREIGITADGFDPEVDPPPFIDSDTGTAYWIGVFQPDKDDPENCVTSILSLGRDPDTGEMEAQLAPCVPGDWDKTYEAAEYLLGVVEKGGIERAFETAEGMALATDQRELWEAERGMQLEPDAATDLADFTRDEWEIDL